MKVALKNYELFQHWALAVQSAKEYRELMEEALRWAKTARTEEERNTFLQIANTWYEAAMLAEGRPVGMSKGLIKQG